MATDYIYIYTWLQRLQELRPLKVKSMSHGAQAGFNTEVKSMSHGAQAGFNAKVKSMSHGAHAGFNTQVASKI